MDVEDQTGRGAGSCGAVVRHHLSHRGRGRREVGNNASGTTSDEGDAQLGGVERRHGMENGDGRVEEACSSSRGRAEQRQSRGRAGRETRGGRGRRPQASGQPVCLVCLLAGRWTQHAKKTNYTE